MAEAVIFDVDGTLLDSVDLHAASWHEIFRRHGIDVPLAAVRSQIGKGADQLLPVFVPKDRLARIEKQLKDERATLFKAEYLPRVRPFPRVRELFQRVKAGGARLVLASSATRDELDGYAKLAGIDDLLEADVSSDDAARSKPHPDIFLAALDRLGEIDRGRVVAVGDTPYDAEAAGKAGLRTVGVLCGGFPEADLRRAGCVAVYRDPADLLANYERPPWRTTGAGRRRAPPAPRAAASPRP